MKNCKHESFAQNKKGLRHAKCRSPDELKQRSEIT
jgi:hypothetical protein